MSGVETDSVRHRRNPVLSHAWMSTLDRCSQLETLAVSWTMLSLGGCTDAPAIDVVGSYFPGWMVCALIGIAGAVGLRSVLVLLSLENSLFLPLVTHAAVALAVTLAVWLVWLGH